MSLTFLNWLSALISTLQLPPAPTGTIRYGAVTAVEVSGPGLHAVSVSGVKERRTIFIIRGESDIRSLMLAKGCGPVVRVVERRLDEVDNTPVVVSVDFLGRYDPWSRRACDTLQATIDALASNRPVEFRKKFRNVEDATEMWEKLAALRQRLPPPEPRVVLDWLRVSCDHLTAPRKCIVMEFPARAGGSSEVALEFEISNDAKLLGRGRVIHAASALQELTEQYMTVRVPAGPGGPRAR